MYFQFLTAILLGILQGITEFLPISSTGHLIIAQNLLGIPADKFGLSFDASVHLGTAIAVFYLFKDRWLSIINGLGKSVSSKKLTDSGRLGIYLLIATIPAAVIGLFLEDKIETVFRNPLLVAGALVAGSIVLLLADFLGKRTKDITRINLFSSFLIGVSQSIALIPGISRSGITISAGMFLNFTREQAAEFAFLLSGPIILGAGGKKLLETLLLFGQGNLNTGDMLFFLLGMVSAGISGALAIKFLLKYLQKHNLTVFVIYRILLAAFIVLKF